jgi:hypothetical protein
MTYTVHGRSWTQRWDATIVDDSEFTALGFIMVPVAVMATDVPNLFHQYRTFDRLVDLLPLAVRLDERFPEAPRPDFVGRLDEFMAVLVNHI